MMTTAKRVLNAITVANLAPVPVPPSVTPAPTPAIGPSISTLVFAAQDTTTTAAVRSAATAITLVTLVKPLQPPIVSLVQPLISGNRLLPINPVDVWLDTMILEILTKSVEPAIILV